MRLWHTRQRLFDVISTSLPGCLSRLAVQSEVRDGRLAVVTPDDISFERSIRLVWSKERSLSVAAEQLVQLIEESSTRGRQL